MYNNTNPAELYNGTTWELLPNDKFLKTGNTPLTQAGSNSVSILKTNLPTDKLQVEVHSMTRGTMNITGQFATEVEGYQPSGAFYINGSVVNKSGNLGGETDELIKFDASRAWTGSTSSASPYTSAMGNGTPLTINPEHIIIKAWKRLS